MNIHHTLYELEQYLRSIDVPIRDLSIERQDYASFTQPHGFDRMFVARIIVELHDGNLEYFQPFIRDLKVIEMPIYDDLTISQVERWDLQVKQALEVKRIYRGTIEFLMQDIGNTGDFIEKFKQETRPLFEAAESKRFDDEVDKMLKSEGEYNN